MGKRCNNEWNRKMDALLLRFKNSITCPDGIPDHNPALLEQVENGFYQGERGVVDDR